MKFPPRLTSVTFAAALVAAPAALAQQPFELLFQQQTHYWYTVESVTGVGPFLEAADDFELVADLHRVRILGHVCWSCAPGDLISARLAFYEWTPNGPGALQQEYVFQDGDPGLEYSVGPGLIDFTLAQPFAASGKHFVSAQVEVAGEWSWWASQYGEPEGATVYSRSSPDGAWAPHVITYPAGPANGDLAFELYGVDDTPPTTGVDPCGPWAPVAAAELPPGGGGVFLRDVAAIASDDVWAVGNYSLVYAQPFLYDTLGWIQHWDGTQWTQVPSPNPEPYPHGGYITLNAVAAVATDDVWAAGSYRVQNPSGGSVGAQVFVLHWDGASWSHVQAPLSPTGSGPTVNDIVVIDQDEIWFFGQWVDTQLSPLGEQRSLALRWDGDDFEVVPTPFFDNHPGYGGGHEIVAADALAPDDVWAVGGAHDSDFSPHSNIFHWDGSTWSHVPGPTPGLYNRLFAVEAIAPDDVWASGSYTEPSGVHVPFFLHWDGSGWTQVPSPGGGMTLVHRPATGDIVSSAGIYGGEGLFRWDGTSWSPVMDFPTVTNPNLMGLALVPGTDCEMWGVGRQNGPDTGGLTVHLDPFVKTAKAQALAGCAASAPPGSLLSSPAPVLGSHVSIVAGDPTQAIGLAPGSPVLLVLGGAPPSACGVVLADLGIGAAPGELLVWEPLALTLVAPFTNVDTPAVFDLALPAAPALDGVQVRAQAVFVDAVTGDLVLSEALALTLGT